MIQPTTPQPPSQEYERDRRLLLRPEHAALLLDISRSKLFSMLSKNELRSIQIGRCRRIPMEALEALIAERSSAEG